MLYPTAKPVLTAKQPLKLVEAELRRQGSVYRAVLTLVRQLRHKDWRARDSAAEKLLRVNGRLIDKVMVDLSGSVEVGGSIDHQHQHVLGYIPPEQMTDEVAMYMRQILALTRPPTSAMLSKVQNGHTQQTIDAHDDNDDNHNDVMTEVITEAIPAPLSSGLRLGEPVKCFGSSMSLGARMERVLTSRLMALERLVLDTPTDALWAEYYQVCDLLLRVRARLPTPPPITMAMLKDRLAQKSDGR